MHYFTPELYQLFNSLDPQVADRADDAWDAAEAAYKARLDAIRKDLPKDVLKLSELCLHDALVVSREERVGLSFPKYPTIISRVAIVSVTMGDEVVSLIYGLTDAIKAQQAPDDWRFSKLQEEWLYDEVDFRHGNNGSFVHRILLSTGVTLEIPFFSVIIHAFTMPAVATGARHSA